jgi:hypothetical protein
LKPDDSIDRDYNVTFNKKATNPIGDQELLKTAEIKGLFLYERIIVIAGKEYLARIRTVFRDKPLYAPLIHCKNMREMIEELNKAIDKGRPL